MDPNENQSTSIEFEGLSLQELANDMAAPAEGAQPPAPPTTGKADGEQSSDEGEAQAQDWEAQWREPGAEEEIDHADDLPPDPSDDKEAWRRERLNKVLEQRNKERNRAEEAERTVIALEARLQALEHGRQQAPQIQPVAVPGGDQFLAELVRVDPEANALARRLEEIRKDPDKFATVAEYTDALTDAKVALRDRASTVRAEIVAEQSRAQVTQQSEVQQIAANYSSAIGKSAIPNIQRFAQVFERVGPALHPEIRRAILSAPDADVLVASIVSDRTRYDRLMDETRRAGSGFPIHGIAAIGEFRAAFKGSAPAPAPHGQTPAKPPQNAPQRQGARVPPIPASRGGGRQSNYDDMDPVEYAEKVMKGQVKNVF